MTLEEAMVKVWRAALVEGAKEVELDGRERCEVGTMYRAPTKAKRLALRNAGLPPARELATLCAGCGFRI